MDAVDSRRKQSGISLVEVMIAMVLGLFLMGSVVQFFVQSRQSNRIHEATARMQETGRMALEILSRDIRMADFWGCASDVDNIVNHLNTGGSGYVDYAAGGVAGTEGGTGVSDALTLRGGFGSGFSVVPPFGTSTRARLNILPGSGLERGDVVLVADCVQGDVFQINNASTNANGRVVHNTRSNVSPGNVNASDPGCPGSNRHCLSKIYGADASIYTMQEITYTVATGAGGEPALFRNGVEFLDGIEELQLLYGEDTDAPGSAGEGIANYYVPADQVADMGRVVGMRIAVVTRSGHDNLVAGGGQSFSVFGTAFASNDNRIRRVYETTVNIRNRQ